MWKPILVWYPKCKGRGLSMAFPIVTRSSLPYLMKPAASNTGANEEAMARWKGVGWLLRLCERGLRRICGGWGEFMDFCADDRDRNFNLSLAADASRYLLWSDEGIYGCSLQKPNEAIVDAQCHRDLILKQRGHVVTRPLLEELSKYTNSCAHKRGRSAQ